ncbi:HBR509Wp [Eremothecium sinecaudum]|uniref:HBR509Wp n=1 Tax=Eremothecium sinecaudum TaxID=45286 RepID=A0A120K1I2_9SACH|nr:HBR509Wp [Eremothecium sinecaudum]AMD19410.1 HBR509Wp [Eremothecium sinecaudum]
MPHIELRSNYSLTVSTRHTGSSSLGDHQLFSTGIVDTTTIRNFFSDGKITGTTNEHFGTINPSNALPPYYETSKDSSSDKLNGLSPNPNMPSSSPPIDSGSTTTTPGIGTGLPLNPSVPPVKSIEPTTTPPLQPAVDPTFTSKNNQSFMPSGNSTSTPFRTQLTTAGPRISDHPFSYTNNSAALLTAFSRTTHDSVSKDLQNTTTDSKNHHNNSYVSHPHGRGQTLTDVESTPLFIPQDATVSEESNPTPALYSSNIQNEQGTECIQVVYTQAYEITASCTTFLAGILSTVTIPPAEYATYAIPTGTITTDISYYKSRTGFFALNNGLRAYRNQIIGGVVGSFAGLVICALLMYGVWRFIKRRRLSLDDQGEFTHDIGQRVGYPVLPQKAASNYRRNATRNYSNASKGASFTLNQNQLKTRWWDKLPYRALSASKLIPTLRQPKEDSMTDNESADPFRDEVNFKHRKRPPPLPPSRSLNSPTPIVPIPETRPSSVINQYSYISSMDESSSDCTTSEAMTDNDLYPIHLDHRERMEMRDAGYLQSHSQQSYLKEMI